jgi:hypothetical protein
MSTTTVPDKPDSDWTPQMFFALQPSTETPKTLLLAISHLVVPDDFLEIGHTDHPNERHEEHVLTISPDDTTWTYTVRHGGGEEHECTTQGVIDAQHGARFVKRATVGDRAVIVYRIWRESQDGGPVDAVDIIINENMMLRVPLNKEKQAFVMEEQGMANYEVGKFDTDKIAREQGPGVWLIREAGGRRIEIVR